MRSLAVLQVIGDPSFKDAERSLQTKVQWMAGSSLPKDNFDATLKTVKIKLSWSITTTGLAASRLTFLKWSSENTLQILHDEQGVCETDRTGISYTGISESCRRIRLRRSKEHNVALQISGSWPGRKYDSWYRVLRRKADKTSHVIHSSYHRCDW